VAETPEETQASADEEPTPIVWTRGAVALTAVFASSFALLAEVSLGRKGWEADAADVSLVVIAALLTALPIILPHVEQWPLGIKLRKLAKRARRDSESAEESARIAKFYFDLEWVMSDGVRAAERRQLLTDEIPINDFGLFLGVAAGSRDPTNIGEYLVRSKVDESKRDQIADSLRVLALLLSGSGTVNVIPEGLTGAGKDACVVIPEAMRSTIIEAAGHMREVREQLRDYVGDA